MPLGTLYSHILHDIYCQLCCYTYFFMFPACRNVLSQYLYWWK